MTNGDQADMEPHGTFKRVPLSTEVSNKARAALKWLGATIMLTYASEEDGGALREECVLIARVRACSVSQQKGGAFHSMTQQLSKVIEPSSTKFHVCLELDTMLSFIDGKKIDRLVVSEKDEDMVLVIFTDDKSSTLAKMHRMG